MTKRPIDTLAAEYLDRQKYTSERIAELHARIKRLQRYGRSWEDDFRETMQGQHDAFVEATIQQLRDESLEPGDLENGE